MSHRVVQSWTSADVGQGGLDIPRGEAEAGFVGLAGASQATLAIAARLTAGSVSLASRFAVPALLVVFARR
jgi:hypothetical protein